LLLELVVEIPMPSADFIMDPWLENQPEGDSSVEAQSSENGFDNNFSERTSTSTEGVEPKPFEKLADSEEYLSRLERKLKRIQSVTNGGQKQNVTSKEIISSLEQTRESYMLRLLNDTVTPAAPENGEGSHDHLNLNPILKRIAPEKQPIALEELVHLLKADQLAAVLEAEDQVEQVAENLESNSVSDKNQEP